jgi:hypothetical protein
VAGEYTFFCRNGIENHEFGTCFCAYQQFRGLNLLVTRWHTYYLEVAGVIIVVNVHAPTEDKIEHLLDKFHKYHMKIMLGDFNAKVGKKYIFKLTTANKSLHEISNDNGVSIVNFDTYLKISVKSTMFPHRNIHKYT